MTLVWILSSYNSSRSHGRQMSQIWDIRCIFLKPCISSRSCCATPPTQHSATWKTRAELPEACACFEGQSRVLFWRRRKLVSRRMNLLCCHKILHSLFLPPSSASSEDATTLWLFSRASKKDPRRMSTYRSWCLAFHSSVWTEQDEPSLHCSIAESSSEKKNLW